MDLLAQLEHNILEMIKNEGIIDEETIDQVKPDTDLRDGYIDSTGVLGIVMLLEDRFSTSEFTLNVLDDDILPENLGTIRSIAQYVKRKVNPEIYESVIGYRK